MENEQDIFKLLAKYFAGEALPEEAMAVDDWRASSPAHSSDFHRFAKIFKHGHQLNQQLAWQKLMGLIDHQPVLSTKVKPYRRLAIAASVFLFLTIATLLIINTQKESPGTIVYQTHATPREIQLMDSSLILVQPNSTLTVSRRFGRTNRSLTLKGSATFNVLHNASKPFIVDMENLHIRDIGTIFTVTTLPNEDSISVKVEEGAVAVYDDSGKSIHLIAGQEIVYTRSGRKFIHVPEQQPSFGHDTVTQTDDKARLPFEGELTKSKLGLTIDEAEKIIGQPVKLIRRDSSFKKHVSSYSGHFKAIGDEANSLYYTITYHTDTVSAHNYYIGAFKSGTGATTMETMLKYEVEAFYQTDQKTAYRVMIRKKNITYTIRINKLKSSVSINELIKKAKRVAQTIP